MSVFQTLRLCAQNIVSESEFIITLTLQAPKKQSQYFVLYMFDSHLLWIR